MATWPGAIWLLKLTIVTQQLITQIDDDDELPADYNCFHPLDEVGVALIRSMSKVLGMSNAAIGRRVGMPRTTVRDIVLKKTWKF